jgi:hypothetical protein
MESSSRARSLLLPLAAALAIAGCATAPRAESIAQLQSPPNEVIGNFGPHRATLSSVLRSDEDVPHGLEVSTEDGWLREAIVYDHGRWVRRFAFHRDGSLFLATYRDGEDGRVEIWSDRADLLFTGTVRGGRRWSGQFLVFEYLPDTYGVRQVMLHEYRDGALARREPFPFERAGVEPPDDPIDPKNWPWIPLEWPDPPYAQAPR